ncbi:MAG: SRPBCC family protein [Paludibacter sp.]|nr:SRPBCC family protein [Paludibacter sp.]
MQTEEKVKITVQTTIEAPVEKVWKCFTTPENIVQWNTASEDWHTTKSENDLRVGGKFNSHMEAKDGSFGFDFWGIYNEIILHEKLASTLGDGRTMEVKFISQNNSTEVIETFEAENQNPVDLQRGGWQAILDNLKKHVEK